MMRAVANFKGAKIVCGVIGAATLTGLSGCINQAEYDRLYESLNSCQARATDLERERNEARLAADQLRAGIGKGEGTLSDLQRQNMDLRAQLDKALADYRNMEGRLGTLTFGPLDAETNQRLDDLAARYPGLLSYDSTRGMLRITSDLTFDSGKAEVKDSAKQALNAFADVLRSGTALQYDVIVEGHTDSQRIANPETMRFHPTNRHLSVHRAISVINVLGGMGIPQDRLMAAGWGEFRPSVTNTGSGNTPQNRRVEIYLAKLNNASAGTGAGNRPIVSAPDDVK